MFRKTILLFFAFGFVLASISSAQFLDISEDNPLREAVKLLTDEKIISVGEAKVFKPEANLSRYEMTVLLYRTLRKTINIPAALNSTMKNFFKDISPANYAYDSIRRLYKAGIISPPASRYFRGSQFVSRYEFYAAYAKMLKKTPISVTEEASSKMYKDVPSFHWAYPRILFLIKTGFLPPPENEQDNFFGNKAVTRKEAAVMIYLAVKKRMETRESQTKEEIPPISTPEAKPVPVYRDVSSAHYAAQDINELVEAQILTPEKGKKFKGDELADQYDAIQLLAGVLEKILGEIKEAPYDLKYKDVSVLNPAYPSIQKLIELGILPAGNNQELFNGQKRINRYQMAYLFFSPLEDILTGTLEFQKADASLVYKDVSSNHFDYPIIQKLIWLGVLDGGKDNRYNGEKIATRYELVHFISKLLKGIYYKLEEKEVAQAAGYSGYGLDLSLTAAFNFLQSENAKTGGGTMNRAQASQIASLAIDRKLGDKLQGYLSLGASYNFGQQTAVNTQLRQGYLILRNDPIIIQAGRLAYFESYDPFGNSLFADALADLVLIQAENDLLKGTIGIGKLIYLGNDLSFDSNAAALHLTPKIKFIDPAEVSLGLGLVNRPLDPSGLSLSGQLECRIYQGYLGTRIPILDNFELNVECAAVSYTNEDAVLPFIGFSAETDKISYQGALSWNSSELNQQLAIGYQKIGDDYYMAQLVDPAVGVGGGQGTSSWLLKFRNFFPNRNYIGFDVENILRAGQNETNRFDLLYNIKIMNRAYLRFDLLRTEDKTAAGRSSWELTGRLSAYF